MTRQLLLELGVADEADLPILALAEADEAFLTSSTREIQPVGAVEGKALPASPGPLTATSVASFAKLLGTDDP